MQDKLKAYNSYSYAKWLIRFAFIIGIIIVLVVKAHYGIHQDEMFSVTPGFDILNEKGFLGRDWVIIQYASIYQIPFILLKETFFQEVGIYLYFRICYIFIQGGICALFYFLLRKHFDENKVFFATLLVAMGYKYFHTMGYLSYYYWFCILIMMMMVKYWYSRKTSFNILYVVLMGVFSAGAIIGYAGCILMPVACIVCISGKSDVTVIRKILYSLLIFGICLGIAIALIVPSFFIYPKEDVIRGFIETFSPEEHEESALLKFLKNGLLYVGIFFVTVLLYWIYKKTLGKRASVFTLDMFMSIIMIAVTVAVCLVKTQTINQNRFFYAVLAISFLSWIFVSKKFDMDKNVARGYVFCFLIPSLFSASSIIIATNTELGGSIFGFMPAVVAFVLMSNFSKFKIVPIVMAGLMTIGLVFFIMESPGNTAQMWSEREYMEEGPAKGLYLLKKYDMKKQLLNQQMVLDENIFDSDKLLIFGNVTTAHNGYLYKYNVEGATFYPNIHLYEGYRDLYFYTLYPDKTPTVIIYDEDYFGDYRKWLTDSQFGRWVYDNYQVVREYDDYGYVVFRYGKG